MDIGKTRRESETFRVLALNAEMGERMGATARAWADLPLRRMILTHVNEVVRQNDGSLQGFRAAAHGRLRASFAASTCAADSCAGLPGGQQLFAGHYRA